MSAHWETSSTLMETGKDLSFHLHRAARGPRQGDSVALPHLWHGLCSGSGTRSLHSVVLSTLNKCQKVHQREKPRVWRVT